MKDLWPNDIAQVVNRTPVTILKEQASLLGSKTKNIVTAEVGQVDEDATSHDLIYRFYIVAPALKNYHYRLFDISHPIDLYPLTVFPDSSVADELIYGKPEFLQAYDLGANERHGSFQVQKEESFLALLEQIFAAQKTRRVIASILGQSTGDYSSNTTAQSS
jgi:hypothetical protein